MIQNGVGRQDVVSRVKRDELSIQRLADSPDPITSILEELERYQRAEEPCQRHIMDLGQVFSLQSERLSQIMDFDSVDRNSVTAVHTANLLNSFFGPGRRSVSSVFNDKELYFSIVRNNVENNDAIVGSCVYFFSYEWYQNVGSSSLCALRVAPGSSTLDEIATDQPIPSSKKWEGHFDSLFEGVKKPHYLIRRFNESTNGILENLTDPFVTSDHGVWSDPYFDCNKTNRWLISYTVPFFNSSWSSMGVVSIDVDLMSMDINQCENGTGIFAGTHKCRNTTTCVPVSGHGFTSGSYECHCKDRYFFPSLAAPVKTFNGSMIERAWSTSFGEPRSNATEDGPYYETDFDCRQCREGCTTCTDDSPCFVTNDVILRAVILGMQALCMVAIIVLIVVILKNRSAKVVCCDSPWMLVVVLIGAFVLYSELIAMYFEPEAITCFLRKWLRGWGFAIAYGMLVLKIYRKLAIFQTRSATRVLVRDRDVLKWLLLIILVLSGYLATWTTFSVQSMQYRGNDITAIGTDSQGMKFFTCAVEWWDYVIDVIEFLFLLFAIYLCYAVRGAPCEFHETRYITVAIYNETILSVFLHVLRHFLWSTTPPDWTFLMTFIHSQLTVTVMVSIIFIPKLIVLHKLIHNDEFRERINSRVVYDAASKWQNSTFLKQNSTSNASSDQHNFNADDVREELKRLYTQLEHYKTKSLRIDNPHLPSKKRSSGPRWRPPRRFSRGHSLRTHSGHSESEFSSEIARSNESLTKAVELHDYRPNHVDGLEAHVHVNQKWSPQS
ncbi:metabotropic glycine receptor-like [Diadema setosum]|uniref:metabotropic glycine receptor-like n=1 Tax=Diadema setosum TaxID=31175 RepID=UPI003B3A5C93